MNQNDKNIEQAQTETEVIPDLELSAEQAEEIQAGLADPITYTFKVTNTS